MSNATPEKQAEYSARYLEKIRQAKRRACAHCGAQFVPRCGTGFKYCSRAHADDAKRARDRARDTSTIKPEDRARWNASYRERHPDRVRQKDRAYHANVRAVRGRGDRSAEYAAKAAQRGSVYVSRAQRAAERVKAEQVKAALRAEREAKRAAKPSKAEQARAEYHSNPMVRQQQIQKARKRKLLIKRNTPSTLTTRQVKDIHNARTTCVYCGCALSAKDKVLDHIHPLSKGGLHEARNLIVCCYPCNRRKAAKLFSDWIKLVPTHRVAVVMMATGWRPHRLGPGKTTLSRGAKSRSFSVAISPHGFPSGA